ncbi:MAG: hypothetical protein ACRDU4_15210 [Mycobacterium sp.]
MRTATKMYKDQTAQERAKDAKLLRESGVHKLVITDRDGNCLAYLLAWDIFGYDPDTDTFVCCVDRDGGELMNIYTEGEVKAQAGTDMYVVTAPDAAAETDCRAMDEAS